jgi:colanic acid/amylovoran biosynthesis glycosyltransferase
LKPVVASYCTYFLKAEMLHIYRQVTSLRQVRTFVITKFRENSDRYPFPDVEVLETPRMNFVRRGMLKYLLRKPALIYRGEFEAIRRILVRRDPDLMHVYFGDTGVHLLPLVERWDRPLVVSFHGMDVQRRVKEQGYEANLRRLLRLASLILVRSRSIAVHLRELDCDPEKIRLNRTGIPLEAFSYFPREQPEDDAWILVQACRLVPKKGLATALPAFAAFLKRFPKSRFVIAGDGPLREKLERSVNDLNLRKSVTFAGFLSQPELRSLYEMAHIFIHPSERQPDSNQEGVPNSMLEAMATGLPVVATRHGGIPEAVTDGLNGFLTAERDDAALTESLFKLARDPALWRKMGQAASQAVRREFEQTRQIETLESAYFEAMERKR